MKFHGVVYGYFNFDLKIHTYISFHFLMQKGKYNMLEKNYVRMLFQW